MSQYDRRSERIRRCEYGRDVVRKRAWRKGDELYMAGLTSRQSKKRRAWSGRYRHEALYVSEQQRLAMSSLPISFSAVAHSPIFSTQKPDLGSASLPITEGCAADVAPRLESAHPAPIHVPYANAATRCESATTIVEFLATIPPILSLLSATSAVDQLGWIT